MATAARPVEQDHHTEPFPAWTDNCILVYGPRKGGTTLLLNLLDGGPELFVYPTEITSKHLIRTDWSSQAVERYRAIVREKDLERAGVPMHAYRQFWDRKPGDAMDDDLAGLVRHDAYSVAAAAPPPEAPQMWCAKDVGGLTHDNIALWRKLFNKAKFVFITRDPAMVTRAVLMDRRRRGMPLTWRQIITQTVDPVRVAKAQARYVDDHDATFITYEDLVADTAQTMHKLAAFVGVPYGRYFEAPTALGKPVVVKTSSQQTDKVFRSNARWHTGLTLREKFLVGATHLVLRFMPDYRLNYAKLSKAISLDPIAAS